MNRKTEAGRFGKFVIVGIINTAVTYIVFVILRLFGATPEISNAIGYVAGVANSFIWNKRWVFQTKGTNVWRELTAFLLIFLLCYGIQFLAFTTMIHRWNMNEHIAQLIGMGIYTILNYMLNRTLAFRKQKK